LPHYHALGRITQFRAEQGSARTLLFTTRVRNTGKIDGEPLHGMVTVRKAGGRVVASSPYPQPSTVLPGYVRDIPVEIRTVLAPGRYTAESNMTLGRSKRSRKRLSFTLTAPNKLPTRRVRIAGLSARGEEGGAAKLDVTVLNSGSADSPTLFTVRLFKLDHGKAPEEPVTEEKRDGGTTKAGERRKISVEVGHLQAGTYRVLLSVSDGQRRGNTYAADFRPAAKRSLATKTKDFFSDHALVFVLLALLLAFAAAAWAVRSRRALERRLAAPRASQQADTDNAVPAAPPAAALPGALAEPEAPPVPVPTEPAATSDLININTAPADELLKLPGVGRKAAERIVAHREEYGEFGSLDDLGHVEGFDDARVRRLSPGATT
jgi:competence ComEA-like helix-hairpin-helix protein